jgi:ribosomal-protein-alanine acetyltransferase
MEIAIMNHSHTETLADLEKLCFSKPWSKRSLDNQIGSLHAYFITALEDEAILGYGGMHCVAGECYIDNIAVFKHRRNKGVGSAIIQALEKEARRRNSEFISLEVRISNMAVELYKKLGFVEEGRRKNFYTEPTEDALILTKRF